MLLTESGMPKALMGRLMSSCGVVFGDAIMVAGLRGINATRQITG